MSEVPDMSIGPTTKYDISKDKENQTRKGTDANPRINHTCFFELPTSEMPHRLKR